MTRPDDSLFTQCAITLMHLKPLLWEEAKPERETSQMTVRSNEQENDGLPPGNDASKPLHAGVLVPLAFSVGTDAEKKQKSNDGMPHRLSDGLLLKPTNVRWRFISIWALFCPTSTKWQKLIWAVKMVFY